MVVLLLVYPKKMNETDALVRPVPIYNDSDDKGKLNNYNN